jgi:hypothetical protein
MNLPSLLWWILLASPDGGDLPSAAREHNDRGVAAILAGDLDGGIAELERAYAAMPDPVLHRAGRGKVLGSLRSALLDRHDAAGDPRDLCRLRELLVAHRDALRAALGPDAGAGSEAELRDVEATLTARAIDCAPPPAAPPPARADPPPEPPARTASPREPPSPRPGRGLRIAGSATLGVGLATLGVAAYGLAVHLDSRSRLQSLTDVVADAGRPATPRERDEAEDLYARGRDHRAVAIAAGTVGAAAVVVGAVLHLVDRRRAQRRPAALAPVLGRGLAGVVVRLRF